MVLRKTLRLAGWTGLGASTVIAAGAVFALGIIVWMTVVIDRDLNEVSIKIDGEGEGGEEGDTG